MKFTTRKTFALLSLLLALLAALLGAIVLSNVIYDNIIASAADIVESSDKISNLQAESTDKLTFTPITDQNGDSAYKVAIKTTYKAFATNIIVPSNYNGLPVTEVAAKGFFSCLKLESVILPNSVKTIGNNAFMNCASLQHIGMPSVETIGTNAFCKCTKLDRVYLSQTVKSVGAYAFRDNPNSIFIQSSEAEVNAAWDSTWSTYITGTIDYLVPPNKIFNYRAIFDVTGTKVIGYEIEENQDISADEIIVYNSYRPNENAEYLPVLNICSGAFSNVSASSIIIRDRHQDDPSAPQFNHKINIRSKAFYEAMINEGSISIEVGVTFDHPKGLQTGSGEGNLLIGEIAGDEEGHSVEVFAWATIAEITLPADLELIPNNMFDTCHELKTIKIAGEAYDGTNVLPAVERIGNGAFSTCNNLSNITIGNSVKRMGESVFQNWGSANDDHVINIDFYQDELPNGWNENWALGIGDRVIVYYKQMIQVTLEWQNEAGDTRIVSLKQGQAMPEAEMPQRNGYIFKGFYTEQNGLGTQFYTDTMKSVRAWNEGDPHTLYAYWTEGTFTVTLDDGVSGIRTVTVHYGMEMPAVSMPQRKGYSFMGYYVKEADGTDTYYYNETMGSERVWDRECDTTLTAKWDLITYSITYYNVLATEISSSNPTSYTVESPDIVLENPTGRVGYYGYWNPSSIPHGSYGNLSVTAYWTPIDYSITYLVGDWKGNANVNILEYDVNTNYVFKPLSAVGYTFSWSPKEIKPGTTGPLTVVGTWTANTYQIDVDNTLFRINENTVQSAMNLPTTYQYGTELDLTQFKPYFLSAQYLSLEGFYNREGHEVTKITDKTTGLVELVAKWRINLNKIGVNEFTVTDQGYDSNKKVGCGISTLNLDNLREIGINQVVYQIKFDYKLIDDGYQYARLYSPSAKETLWEVEISGEMKDKYTEYYSGFILIDFDTLGSAKDLQLQFDASGAFADDWSVKNLKVSVQLIGKGNTLVDMLA